jgi:hypothetical protein
MIFLLVDLIILLRLFIIFEGLFIFNFFLWCLRVFRVLMWLLVWILLRIFLLFLVFIYFLIFIRL